MCLPPGMIHGQYDPHPLHVFRAFIPGTALHKFEIREYMFPFLELFPVGSHASRTHKCIVLRLKVPLVIFPDDRFYGFSELAEGALLAVLIQHHPCEFFSLLVGFECCEYSRVMLELLYKYLIPLSKLNTGTAECFVYSFLQGCII
jgi:hypothetical protein